MTDVRRRIHLPEAFRALRRFILASYEKQQRRVLEEFGGDEGEVRKRVSRMAAWADFCETEKPEPVRSARFVEAFGHPEAPVLDGPRKQAKCERCRGVGVYWSENCAPKLAKGRSAPGFVACRCEGGQIKNRAIRDHGKRLERQKRYANREEF